MSKILIVAKREYVQRVRTKGFVIFTVLLPAIIGGYILVGLAISRSGANASARLAVVDLSGQVLPALQHELDERLPSGRRQFQLDAVAATTATLPATEARLHRQVLGGQYTGFLVIPANVLQSNRAEYHAKNVANFNLIGSLQHGLESAVSRVRLQRAGVAAGALPQFFADFHLTDIKLTASGENADAGGTVVLGYILGGLLYGVLLGYGMTFMRSVVEEKTNRVAEVVLASVDAFGLLSGKIIGVAGAALTQALIWAICLGLFVAYAGAASLAAGQARWLKLVPHIGPMIYVSFVLFFVLGFLVYGSIYAAVGAIVSSEQEAQQSQMPITMLLLAALFLGFTILTTPNSTLAIVLSEIPFFAPVLMMMRIPIANPPFWQVGLSWILCALAVWLIMKVTARLYRVGILMTGKRPNLSELMRWLRYS
ncbi:MAG: ABC transporter permease [Terriglobales bacterium]